MNQKRIISIILCSLALISVGVFLADFISISPKIYAKEQYAGYLKEKMEYDEEHSKFAIIAKNAIPAVVSIKVERSVEYKYISPFNSFGDDFFNFFEDRSRRKQKLSPQKHIVKNQGSGFIYSKDGYIMTNNHVVEKADKIIVKRYNGEELEAKIIGCDPETDFAIIKVNEQFESNEVLPLGESKNLWVGDYAISIGSPYSLEKTVTVGVVSAKGRHGLGIAEGPSFQDFIQTDAAINPGNSGGPLLDIKGRVIGINAAINARAQGIGFAIPIDLAKRVETTLRETGEVKRGYLGVKLRELSHSEKDIFGLEKDITGILISEVEKNTPAEKSGLKTDDIIISLNNKKITSFEKFRFDIASNKPADKVKLTILREGNEKQLSVKLGDRSEYLNLPVGKRNNTPQEQTLGMDISNLRPALKNRYNLDVDEGVFIKKIHNNSKAFGKLKTGDVIVKVILDARHYSIKNVADFKRVLKKAEKKNKNFLIKFLRHGTYGITVINYKE